MRISLKARTVITIVFVLCLGAYITLDCIKLKQSSFGTKPIITVWSNGKEEAPNYSTYIGLGYTVKYSWNMNNKTTAEEVKAPKYGAEFKLFGFIPIWNWIK